jgi:hypothetical protein
MCVRGFLQLTSAIPQSGGPRIARGRPFCLCLWCVIALAPPLVVALAPLPTFAPES